ncbi:MAG: GEVED domain-containing protein, partial [Bacteroidia bacterium]|nr:GEVED domain-containing protein [Bacteroidia bacterium]
AGEFVFSTNTWATTPFSGTVNIPFSTALGPTRMRVRSRWAATMNNADHCTQFVYGETEDYTLDIRIRGDDPCAAIPLTVGASCVYGSYTTSGATSSSGVPDPGCAYYDGNDIWFSMTVPPSGHLIVQGQYTGGIYDGGLAFYTGTCGSLNLIACDDDGGAGLMPKIDLCGLTPGITIYARFWAYGNFESGSFGLCAYNGGGAPPDNDLPCNATNLLVFPTCNFTTYSNSCATNSPVPNPGCANYQGKDVWFTATVPSSGHLVVETQAGTMVDGGIAVYTGTCSSLTLAGCEDDNGVGLMPRIDLCGMTPFTQIFIRMWGYGTGNNGTFGICAYDGGGTPTNDEACTATPLTVTTSCGYVPSSNSCATASSNPNPGCGLYSGGDVWYSIVVPPSGNLVIQTQAGTLSDGAMALYRGTSCTSLTLVECNDDYGASFMPYIKRNGLTPGSTVWLRFWEYGGDNNGTYSICVRDSCAGVTSLTWNGSVNTDWFNPGNWGGCLPHTGTDVLIPSGLVNYPNINANGAACRNLNLQNGASLSFAGAFNFTIAGTFTHNGTLNAGTGTFTWAGNSIQTYTGSGTGSFYNVTVNNEFFRINLGRNMTINNVLLFQKGYIRTNSFEVIIESNASNAIQGFNNVQYIEGRLRRRVLEGRTYDFPIATNGRYQRAQVTFAATPVISGMTHLRAQFDDWTTAPTISLVENGSIYNCAVNNHGNWILDPTNASGTQLCTGYSCQYTLQLYPLASAPSCSNGNPIGGYSYWTMMKQPSPGCTAGAWQLHGTPSQVNQPFANLGTVGVSRAGQTTFSRHAVVGAITPFPVELLLFTATPQTQFILLQWKTATEINNAGFVVEKSLNGTQFDSIAWVVGQGNSNTTNSYQEIDLRVTPGIRYYYRLKQVDWDGSFHYSPIIEAIIPTQTEILMEVYPNPTDGNVTLQLSSPFDGEAEFTLKDLVGKNLWSRQQYIHAGKEIIPLEWNFPSGCYLLQVKFGNEIRSTKLIIQ